MSMSNTRWFVFLSRTILKNKTKTHTLPKFCYCPTSSFLCPLCSFWQLFVVLGHHWQYFSSLPTLFVQFTTVLCSSLRDAMSRLHGVTHPKHIVPFPLLTFCGVLFFTTPLYFSKSLRCTWTHTWLPHTSWGVIDDGRMVVVYLDHSTPW